MCWLSYAGKSMGEVCCIHSCVGRCTDPVYSWTASSEHAFHVPPKATRKYETFSFSFWRLSWTEKREDIFSRLRFMEMRLTWSQHVCEQPKQQWKINSCCANDLWCDRKTARQESSERKERTAKQINCQIAPELWCIAQWVYVVGDYAKAQAMSRVIVNEAT